MTNDNNTTQVTSHTLLEVLNSIQSVLQKAYKGRQYWVRCELARISQSKANGHCYLELIEKNDKAIVAQQNGMIWSDRYLHISAKFREATGMALSSGIKVMLQCSISFHAVYGLSLTVTDIEPAFTLGELARTKNESIRKLKADGLFNLNKGLSLPGLPGRIAVISASSSRGYLDFVKTIADHPRMYSIRPTLFEAILQGENAVPSLLGAINKINSLREYFDVIAIIRGGAGDAGLSCYDEYDLASAIARSPLPVITGIGHSTNETVAELVAYKNCITPTAAATFILDCFDAQFAQLENLSERLSRSVNDFLFEQSGQLTATSANFSSHTVRRLAQHRFDLKTMHAGLPAFSGKYFSIAGNTIQHSIASLLKLRYSGFQKAHLRELRQSVAEFKNLSKYYLRNIGSSLNGSQNILKQSASQVIRSRQSLDFLADKISLLDPVNTLKRGYSVTRINDRVITGSHQASTGDVLETQLASGKISSTVI